MKRLITLAAVIPTANAVNRPSSGIILKKTQPNFIVKQPLLTSSRFSNNFPAFVLLVLAAMLLCQPAVLAQTFTWDGGGGDDNFGTGANWNPDGSPSVGSGVVLQFTGSTRLTPFNNYTTGDNFGEWHLLNGAGGDFTISGNGFGLYNKIENDAGSGRTFTVNTAGIFARDGSIELNPVGGNLIIGGSIELDGNSQLNVYDGNNARTLTLNGALSNGNGTGGDGSLVLNQTAIVILAADSDFGGTTINAGTTLRVGAGGGTGTLGVGNTANSGSLIFNRTGSLSYGGILSGAGTLTKQASGTVTLTGANTYTGITTITGGSLSINADARLGTAPGAATPGNVVLNGGALSSSATFTLSANRGIALGPTSGTGSGTIDVASAQTLTYLGIAANNGAGTGSLTKTGDGILTLGGANTYSGGTLLSGGSVYVNVSGALGAGTLTMQNGTLFRLNGAAGLFPGNAITVAAGASVSMNAINNTIGYGGNVTSGDSASVLNILNTVNFSAANIKQFASGFTGTVTIPTGGNLQPRGTITTTGNGGDNATFNVTGTGRIDTRNGGNMALGALTGDGIISGPGGADGTLIYTIGAKGTDTTFSGSILTGSSGLRLTAVTKTGAGKLTLSGTALSYTGTTTVSGGILNITGTKTGVGAVNVNSGGTLMGTGSVAGLTTVASGGKLSPGTSVGTLSLSSLTLSSGSIITNEFNGTTNDLTVVSTSGGLTINGGSVQVVQENTSTAYTVNGTYNLFQYTGAIGGVGASALSVGNPQVGKSYTFGTAGGYVTLTISDGALPFYWNVNTDGSWTTGANWTGGTAPNSVGGFAGLGTNITAPRTVSLDGSKTVGELQFNNANAYTVAQGSGGTLTLTNVALAAKLTDLAGSHVVSVPVHITTVGVDAAIAGSGDTLTVSGNVSGSGVVNKTGLGTLALHGVNSHAGTTLTGGTLAVTNDTGFGASGAGITFAGGSLTTSNDITLNNRAITASSTATLNVGSGTLTSTNPITGAGGLTKNGTGTLTLSGTNTYNGATTVNVGVAQISGGVTTNSASHAVNASGNAQLVVAGGEFGGASLNIATPAVGVLVSSGSMTLSGALTMNSGGSQASQSGLIAVTGGSLSNASLAMGRMGAFFSSQPTAGATGYGFYVNGGSANISGNVSICTASAANSANSMRMDSGSLTVGGSVTLGGGTSGGRWTVLDVNGGTLAVNDTTTGINIGFNNNGTAGGSAELLIRAGTSTAGKISLGSTSGFTGTAVLNQTGGSLYVGSGGIAYNGFGTPAITLNGGTLGAAADWSSSMSMTLGSATIKAADVADTARNITLSGALSGGSLTKTGGGTLTLGGTNTYTGNTTISNGMLTLGATASLASADINVASGASLDVTAGGMTLGASQTLHGNGTVSGTVVNNGTIAGGASIGTLTFGSAPTLNSGGAVIAEINRNGGSPLADKLISSSGTLTFGGTLTITNVGAAPQNGDTFDLFDGTLSGSFGTVNVPNGAVHWNTGDLNVGGTITFTNAAPVAKNITAGVAQGGTMILPVIGGKNTATDAEGDSLSVTAVGTASSGSASFGASNVTYVASGSTGTNTFTYTVTDALGATDTKTMTVVVGNPQGFNQVNATNLGGNTLALSYLGIPGYNYALDWATNLSAPINWMPVVTNTAQTNGWLNFTNTGVGMDFYRTRYAP